MHKCASCINNGRGTSMPNIMPIRDLRKTSELSELAHRVQEPIFVTKNGYSDLVIMSAELFDRYASELRIDRAIFEAEQELKNGARAISADKAFAELDAKYYGKI